MRVPQPHRRYPRATTASFRRSNLIFQLTAAHPSRAPNRPGDYRVERLTYFVVGVVVVVVDASSSLEPDLCSSREARTREHRLIGEGRRHRAIGWRRAQL
uniref:Uncharacterized protein n=1 Tax=Plectus sambesii TaxID=2011161 RepID=A0A914VNH5_9BILA